MATYIPREVGQENSNLLRSPWLSAQGSDELVRESTFTPNNVPVTTSMLISSGDAEWRETWESTFASEAAHISQLPRQRATESELQDHQWCPGSYHTLTPYPLPGASLQMSYSQI